MQTEKYCDRKDEWKWTYVLSYVSNVGGLYYFPCLRPNLGRAPLKCFPRSPLSVTHDRVHACLNSDRIALAPSASEMLKRIARLVSSVAPGSRYETVPKPIDEFSFQNATVQFTELRVALQQRPDDQRDVVFLDPDKGIIDGLSYAKTVGLAHLQVVWPAVRQGDWLIVYHSVPRELGWSDGLRKLVKARLTPTPMTVWVISRSAALVVIAK